MPHDMAGAQVAVDPVCGMAVDSATAPVARRADGSAVFFCSEGCTASFTADPHRYPAVARIDRRPSHA